MSNGRGPPKHFVRIEIDGLETQCAVSKDEFTIGRDSGADVKIAHPEVSRRHLNVRIVDGQIFVKDLGSTSGSFLGSQQLRAFNEVQFTPATGPLMLAQVAKIIVEPAMAMDFEADMQNLRASDAAEEAALKSNQFELQKLQNSMAEAQRKESEARQVYEAAERLKSESKAELQALTAERTRLQAELKAGVNQLMGVRTELQGANDAIKNTRAEILKLQREETAAKIAADMAEGLKAEALNEMQELNTERDRLRVDIRDSNETLRGNRTDVTALRTEKSTLEKEIPSLRETLLNFQTAAADARHRESEARLARDTAEKLKTETKAELETLTTERDRAKSECLEETKKLDALRQETVVHKAEKELLDKDVPQMRKALSELDRERERVGKELEVLRDTLKSMKPEAERESEQLRKIKDSRVHEQELFDAELRKRQAQFEAMAAEYRVKELGLEASVRQVELKRIEAEEKLYSVGAQHRQIEQEARTQTTRNEKLTQDFERLKAEVVEVESQLAGFKASTVKATSAATEADEALHKAEERNKEAFARFAAEFERETTFRKQALETEIASRKQALESETAARKKAIETDMTERARRMESELADARLRENAKIERMFEDEKRATREKLKLMIEEITRKAIELSGNAFTSDAESVLRTTIRATLEGKTVATATAEGVARTRQFWRKIAIRVSIPAALVLLFALFPKVPGRISDNIRQRFASKQLAESGAFLDEIRKRGMKYQPPTDHNYRASYSDNILYLESYMVMKLDDNEQRTWTLMLNDFLTGRLGLSDQVIADFVASEAVLIRELLKVADGILPQFKEQGIAKMNETEKSEITKMMTILQSDENYAKFRALEKDFYADYLNRRAPASTK